ncbi:MAG: LapA family protein [Deltaproteobacteria bacterium]|nr:LapA family protein [Deltaproteobacteria bacterium]
MKKIKIVLWIIFLGFMAIVFFSNKDYFLVKQGIQIDVPFSEPFQIQELPNVIYFLVFFLAGFLVAYFISLSERFKSKKTIKNLNAAATSQLEEISVLKKEVDSLKSSAFNSQTAPEDQNMTGTT